MMSSSKEPLQEPLTFAFPSRPPRVPAKPVSFSRHGVTWDDPFAWLRADNWRDVLKDPRALPADIAKILKAENRYTEASFEPLKTLQRTLVREMRGRILENESSVPVQDGDYLYFSRYQKGAQYPQYCRRAALPSLTVSRRVEIMLDAHAMAKPYDYFDLSGVYHSPDHRLLAYALDIKGSEYYTLHVKDLTSGQLLEDIIEDVADDVVWSADSAGFFYIRVDANHRPKDVMYHRLGTSRDDDMLIYHEADDGWFLGIDHTLDRSFLTISAHDHESSEVWVVPLDQPLASPRCLAPRAPHVEYSVEHHPMLGGTFFFLSNHDGAEDFAVFRAPSSSSSREAWVPVIPAKSGCLRLSLLVFEDYLVRLEREDGLPRLVVRRFQDGHEWTIAFDEEAYSLGVSQGAQFQTHLLRFGYSSMTTPHETWEEDLRNGQRALLKRQNVPSGHNPHDYVTRRLMAKAPDGQGVPVSLLMRRDTPLDGSAPCLLYGYGAYGHAMSAGFSVTRLSLVDRGFVFALAHVRGGMDKGYAWYKNGKREHKTNTFTDFIAVAEHLIAQKYTQAGRLVAHGGSAGGMLMGAVANMRPDLFAGIIADVPFVDVLNTMLDAELPLTPPEWPEWGNPIEDEEAFHRLKSYSPYDNVTPQAYPAMLILGGLTDPRVTYWEPAKWAARLRQAQQGAAPIFLKINMDAGHGGTTGRFDFLKEIAQGQAFALAAVAKKY